LNEPYDIPDLVAQVRSLHDRQTSTDDVLRTLRAARASPIACIAVLRELFGWTVSEAKSVVWASEVWREHLPAQAELENTLERIAGERDATEP
jgi:hypothetical protein